MKNWFTPLNGAITLSVVALLETTQELIAFETK